MSENIIDKIKFKLADSVEISSIQKLLQECGLPYNDITDHISNFILAKNGSDLIGTIGLEMYGNIGMIRSLAVTDSYRGKSIAKALYTRILAYAHLHGIEELYLLTTTAEGFFLKNDFRKLERNNVPETIHATNEFQNLCPSTALCMVKEINKEAQYYPKDVLTLQPDVPGAKMWSTALKNVMFTYFEVDPNSRFETHTHESEQITMVLEGELFFEVNGKIKGVKKGEVMAVPAAISHSVFTKNKSVKAVDAWSPVMKKYTKQ